MTDNAVLIGHVAEVVGPLWLVAVAGMFLSAVCESARPKPAEGEAKSNGVGLLIAGIASLLTPILLFIGGFWSIASFEGVEATPDALIDLILARQTVVLGLLAFLAGVAIIGSIIGWIARAVAPAVGRALNVAAIPLAVATLALTVFVTHDDVAVVLALVGA